MPSDAAWPRVIGQARVKHLLVSALRTGRLPHAYLFHGAEGVGKDAVALELARVIHCEAGGEEACGACPSCLKLDSLQHPDVRFVMPLPVGKGEQIDDGPLQRLTEPDLRTVQEELRRKGANPYHRVAIPRATIIKINSVREIRREASLRSFTGRRRVFVISEADLMGDQAANTLLKTLEEPAGESMLILTTAHREALLPTILSRCQSVRFDPLTEEQLREALVARDAVDPAQAALVARLANGSYAQALRLLREEVLAERRNVLDFVRHLLTPNTVVLVGDVQRLAALKDRERVIQFLMLLMMWLRDALVLSRGSGVINVDQEDDLRRFNARFPQADLPAAVREVDRAISLVRKNVYIKLVLVQLALRLRSHILAKA